MMNLTLCDPHDPLCVIILTLQSSIELSELLSPEKSSLIQCFLFDNSSLTVILQAGEITYTNTNQPRVGEGIVEFGSRFESEAKKLVIKIMIQGDFFHWYPPKNSKCQPVSKF